MEGPEKCDGEFRFKLCQAKGIYSLGDKSFEAGKIYSVPKDVSFSDANYLINEAEKARVIIEKSSNKGRYQIGNDGGLIDTKKSFLRIDNRVLEVPSSGQVQIGLIRLGGLGDSLIVGGLAKAIKRKYPKSFLTVYIRNIAGMKVLDGNPSIDRIVITNNKVWDRLVDNILERNLFDIFFDNRYVTKVHYKNPEYFIKDKIETDKSFKSMNIDTLFNNFPYENNEWYKKLKMNEYEASLKSACLIGSRDDLFIKLSVEDYACTDILEGTKYVTIHNGADVGRQTKCWLNDGWKEIVVYLKTKKYKVIQLGIIGDEPIEGVINMNGKTSIKQASAIIEGACFHIDTESGLVHFARAVRTRSIVLFGPTSLGWFKYDENINIQSPYNCIDCWWKDSNWWRECRESKIFHSSCMEAITSSMVVRAINSINNTKNKLNKRERVQPEKMKEDLNEKFAEELLLNEAHYKSEPWQYERVELMMSKCKEGGKVLEVGAGDGYCVEQLLKRGYDVEGVEYSPIRLARCQAKKLPVKFGDVCCLPFPDNSFDSVCIGEVLEHIPSFAAGLKECERVCKPDGNIILSVPINKIHDKTKMHLWGIRHNLIYRNKEPDMMILEMKRINRDE